MNSIKHLLKDVDSSDINWIFQLANNVQNDSDAIDVIIKLMNLSPYVIEKILCGIEEDFNECNPECWKDMLATFNIMQELLSNISVIVCSKNIRRPEIDPDDEESVALSTIRRMSGCEDG